jgi:hypothetical protein
MSEAPADGKKTVRELAWPWPFSRGDLTAGLRRHTKDLSLNVDEVRSVTISRRRPAIGLVRGMMVRYHGQAGDAVCNLVVKEPRGITRTGLAGAGRREVGVYQFLAEQLPVECPTLIAASLSGDWLLLDAVPTIRDASGWISDDYREAIKGMVALHDRFWGLGEDLNAFSWLSRPLTKDFEVHVTGAAYAIERIVFNGQPESLADSPERMQALAHLTADADRLAAPLRKQPRTFLHGDFWPGNISITSEGRHVVYDWQLAAIGPAILDLVTFIQKSRWWFGTLPMSEEEIIAVYRKSLKDISGFAWGDEEWAELWEHARMWRFLQEWIDLLAISPNPLLEINADQLDRVWLEPVMESVKTRLAS